ncbi:hypothetical protein Gbem_1159 [Citrifermentans bemidjiense Bem]|uniref:Fibritin C-terminal domain-containing protein n=1 Tax=Citrifermentans bemidjiense (strain ATCC BAA-1014 / DSM 16622 / JCM 12645 / Bem) TaxID=404380 RepID=B5EHG8_CITBB|nr:phage neck protein fibritin [Citrifermentans bemidjiense]ACH38178.1 hypothetical protein Gbem_1159 [Citrifermentans bemidjiense Bem]
MRRLLFALNLSALLLALLVAPALAAPADQAERKLQGAPVSLKHAELMALRNQGGFVPGQWYRIADFRTRWRSYITGIVHEAPVEPLLVQAITSNRLAILAYSERYPNDEIDYLIYDGSLHGEIVNGVEIPSNDRGGIVRRKDINRGIECWFDFRAYTVRLFETAPGSGVYRDYGKGPAYVDRPLLQVDNSSQVVIKKAGIPWRGEDGAVADNMGYGNPEHYLEAANKVQIGMNSFNIKIYGNEVTSALFGECTDDIVCEGSWRNSQMVGFNNTVNFGGTVETSFFMGGTEVAKVSGDVTRSVFLPGVVHATFNGRLTECMVFSGVDSKSYDGDRRGEFIGQSAEAIGAVGDAPKDGKLYVRQNGRWVELVTAAPALRQQNAKGRQ